jgi:threonine dehydrogenase-like Zn-dependent dehydrogenase
VTASYSCGPKETRAALAMLDSGEIDPGPLVTMRVGLPGVGEAIRRTVAKSDDLKAIVYPHRATDR